MILYLTLGISDIDRARAFYDAVLGTIGMTRQQERDDGWLGYGPPYGQGTGLYLSQPWGGGAPEPGRGPMVAFAAPDGATVRAFHAAALASGGTDEGPPGLRDYYSADFYPAYVRDPDGNKLACVCWQYDGD